MSSATSTLLRTRARKKIRLHYAYILVLNSLHFDTCTRSFSNVPCYGVVNLGCLIWRILMYWISAKSYVVDREVYRAGFLAFLNGFMYALMGAKISMLLVWNLWPYLDLRCHLSAGLASGCTGNISEIESNLTRDAFSKCLYSLQACRAAVVYLDPQLLDLFGYLQILMIR